MLTKVLDSAVGRPAAGVAVSLELISLNGEHDALDGSGGVPQHLAAGYVGRLDYAEGAVSRTLMGGARHFFHLMPTSRLAYTRWCFTRGLTLQLPAPRPSTR
jgi:hypothetical protein